MLFFTYQRAMASSVHKQRYSGSRPTPISIIAVLFSALFVVVYSDQRPRDGSKCTDRFGKPQRCIPEFVNAAFNILVEATNTCGTGDSPTEFCVQTGVTGAKKFCDICDARSPRNSHGAEYLTDFNNNDNLTWWQSETLLEARNRLRDLLPDGAQIPLKVNLTLRLRKAFDITYVRLKFHSSRPESFSIYKRTSESSPWIPYQFYSGTCRDTYGLPDYPHVLGEDETQPLCTDEYSDISPLTGGNVAFSTLEGRPSANNYENSPVLQEWVTATDIRITLDRLNMFGDEVFGDPKVLKSYFYAVSDFAVGGRCKCNGHASECVMVSDRLMCQCEHHTDGADCDKCLPFYNDQPWRRANGSHANECHACNCSGRSHRCYFNATLHEQTHGRTGGYCMNCTGNFDGPNCEVCREDFYLRSDGVCIPCGCNEIGSYSLQCNNFGRCQCKAGVTGEKCDQCEANHYDFNFQGCRQCGCSLSGSFSNTPNCDQTHGICQCKENVEGQRCDSCKPGYFNLDAENEFGCTPCFCYGHSSVCHSAPGYSSVSIESLFNRDAEHWTARDQDGNSVSMQYNALSRNMAVSAPFHGTAYFLAPKQFLGDQRGSYNQHLSFEFRINHEGPRATIEDLVLEGVGLKISQPIFGQGNPLPTSRDQMYKFRLHEHQNYGWHPSLSSRDFISILANLTAIKIRATYTTDGAGFLDNVKLESAQRVGFGVDAKWMEMCTCNEGYLGQFCESCAPGYRHDPPGSNPFARCIPCNCHGHADICDDATGRCMCRHNTAGDHCERCARGFYGNALRESAHDCKPCPCPNQGSCIDLGDEVVCLECPQGYGGHLCDVCTDGYFGDPTGRYGTPSSCFKCDCNGNVDPNAVGNCNKTGGACLKCIHNTAGVHCERCLPGYHGDALAVPKGDCKPCNCNPLGSQRRGYEAIYCDSLSGQCECAQHVRGLQCDRCVDGYWNLESGTGCESCNCDSVGSKNDTCDIRTGQCHCHPGVGGQHCDQCLPYHFALSYTGCTACDCDPIGSASLQCDTRTGQCQCRENVEGRKCDRCKENKYDKHAGCVACPACYNLVQDAVSDHRSKLFELEELLESIETNPNIVADLDFGTRLQEVMLRIDDLLRDAERAGGIDKGLLTQLENLRKRLETMEDTAGKITEKVNIATSRSKEGVRNITEAEEIIQRIREALKNAQRNVRDDGAVALEKATERSKKFGQQSNRMSQIAREASEEAKRQEEEAKVIDDLAKQALNTSQEAYNIANNASNQQRETGEEIYQLRRDLDDTSDLMHRTTILANDAQKEANSAYQEVLDLYTDAQGLLLPDADMEKLNMDAEDIQEEARKIQDEADLLLHKNKVLLDDLQTQMTDAQKLLAKGDEEQQTADRLLSEVDAAAELARTAVELGEKTLEEANKTYLTLKGFDELVQDNKGKADEALKKIPEIEALIREAETKTDKAQESLVGAGRDANDARDIAFEAKRIAESASKDANMIRHEADDTKVRANRLKDDADDLAKEVANTGSQLQDLNDQADRDRNLAKEALERANEAKGNAQESSRKVKNALNTVNNILDTLGQIGAVDTDQLRDLDRKLTAAERELEKANLDRRMAELRAARTLQNQWMREYDEEIRKLTLDVKNIKSIRDSLPQQCYRRVVLEPEQ